MKRKGIFNTNLVKMTGDDRASVELFNSLDIDYYILCDDTNLAFEVSKSSIISLNSQGPYEASINGPRTITGHLALLAQKMLTKATKCETCSPIYKILLISLSAMVLHAILFINIIIRTIKLKIIKRRFDIRLIIAFNNMACIISTLSWGKGDTIFVVPPITYENHGKKFNTDVSREKYGIEYFANGSYILDKIYMKLGPKLYNKFADSVIASSKYMYLALKRAGVMESKLKLINYPVNTALVRKLSTETLDNPLGELFKKYRVIVTAGRLASVKGQWYLIRIFRELLNFERNLKLFILGDGPLRDYLINLSDELGLRSYAFNSGKSINDTYDLYFLGFQKNPYKFISKSQIFVLPSLSESLGLVILESLALGIPVVSSDTFGARQILAPESDVEFSTDIPEFARYGILMPPFEPVFKDAKEPLSEIENMYVDILKRMLLDERLRKYYSEVGPQRTEDFDVKKISERWQNLINNSLREVSKQKRMS